MVEVGQHVIAHDQIAGRAVVIDNACLLPTESFAQIGAVFYSGAAGCRKGRAKLFEELAQTAAYIEHGGDRYVEMREISA